MCKSRTHERGRCWVAPGNEGAWLTGKGLGSAAQASLLSCRGRTHTYIKDEGRGRREALDADVREHFEHVAFSACHIDESERAIRGEC